MASEGDAVYCTLLLSDHYLPGAMVLAHSLRDNGTNTKLVVLYTPDNLQSATINELRTIYDGLIPVEPTVNGTPANLWLMDRPDLISAFTKIELWNQTQFSRVVYIDCDVVALRAPDELFDLDAEFAAVPDVGWPDCFNSGVMVLRPNLQDYHALKTLAERGISFDGADQGLLNEHFRDWHRLSFTYNCTPSANYQYIPAYKHFQSTISMIHFIGADKPWGMSRHVDPVDSPYNQLLGRWWAVYDKHYRPVEAAPVQQPSRPSTLDIGSHEPEVVPRIQHFQPITQDLGAGAAPPKPWEQQPEHWPGPQLQTYQPEYRPHHPESAHASETRAIEPAYHVTEPMPCPVPLPTEHVQEAPHEHTDMHVPVLSAVPRYVRGEEHVSTYIQVQSPNTQRHTEHHWEPETREESDDPSIFLTHEQPAEPVPPPNGQHEAPPPSPKHETQSFDPPKAEWDASREPPPRNTKPEGISLQRQTYTMSDDTHLFQPPSSYPEAPKDKYYQIPETKPEPQKLIQLFPWESHAPKPTRVFVNDDQSLASAHGKYSAPPMRIDPEASGHTSRTFEEPPDTWENYPRSNAWDEVPEIQRYIQTIQESRKQARKAKTQVISGTSASPKEGGSALEPPGHQQDTSSTKLTDFPSEIERPSLPVTPAPIRRPSAWNQSEQTTPSELPDAEGVPNQEEWNPLARLEELRRRQSEVLDNPDLLLERLHRLD